jgi:hypothetical protein
MSMTTTASPVTLTPYGRQVDQPRLFRSRDHPGANARLIGHRLQELAAVLGLARGAGRGGQYLVDFVGFGQTPELREHL